MKVVKGDLLKLADDGEFEVIIHGCNCFSQMGAGIAKSIKQKWPNAYKADQSHRGKPKQRLGGYSMCMVRGDLTVINAYTQLDWRGKKGTVNADYKAIRSVFRQIKEDYSGFKIGYPLIGAGLAGGDWDVISKIINEELEGEDHTLVVLPH